MEGVWGAYGGRVEADMEACLEMLEGFGKATEMSSDGEAASCIIN